MNMKNKLLKKIKGFTLVEIMIVVTIIGILASLAVPAFQRARWKALETSIRNNLRQVWGAAQQYMLENGVDSVSHASIIKWQTKTGAQGTGSQADNPGYTSVLKQIADEDYSKITCTCTNTTNPTEGTIYADATKLTIGVTGGTATEVTLDL